MRFLNHHSTFQRCSFVNHVHPGRLRWNLQITHLERKMIFQTFKVMFHVNLQGCMKSCLHHSSHLRLFLHLKGMKCCRHVRCGDAMWKTSVLKWGLMWLKSSESGGTQQKSTRTKDGWMICVCVFVLCFFSAPENRSVYSILFCCLFVSL